MSKRPRWKWLVPGMAAVLTALSAGTVAGFLAAVNRSSPEDVARQYYEAYRLGNAEVAYRLTSRTFQELVPLQAFQKAVELDAAVHVQSFTVGPRLESDSNRVVLELAYAVQGPSGTATVKKQVAVVNTGEGWRVDVPPGGYVSIATELAEPIASTERNGVSLAVKPIRVRTSILRDGSARSATDVYVVVTNHSGKTLRFDLTPHESPGGAQLLHRASGQVYHLVLASIRGPRTQQEVSGQGGQQFFAEVPDGGSATLHLQFEPVVEGATTLALKVGPFSFPGGELWFATIDGIETRVVHYTDDMRMRPQL